MGNVIKFPEFEDGQPQREAFAAQIGGHEASQAQVALDRRRRAEQARRVLREARSFTDADVAVVAANTWKMLQDLEDHHGVTKARFLELAGKGGGRDSTKRLPRYTLPPGLSGEVRAKRRRELSKQRSTYVIFAAKAAELAGRSADDELLGLLAGTSILRTAEGMHDSPNSEVPPDWAADLATLFEVVSAGVAREADLPAHHRRLGVLGIRPLPDDHSVLEAFPAMMGRAAPAVADTDLRSMRDTRDLLALYPQILLGEFTVGERFPVTATVVLKTEGPAVMTWDVNGRLEGFQSPPDQDPIRTSTTATYLAEVRLALLPFAPTGSFAPTLLVRGFTDVEPILLEDVDGRLSQVVDEGRLPGLLSGGGALEITLPGYSGTLTLTADTTPLNWLRTILASDVAGQDKTWWHDQTRVYNMTAARVRAILGQQNTNDFADWVGPENRREGGFAPTVERERKARQGLEYRAQKLGRDPDELAGEEEEARNRDEHGEEMWLRPGHFDPDHVPFGHPSYRHIVFAPPGTLAAKLERSLLDLPGEKCPTSALLSRALRCTAAAKQAAEKVAEQRQKGMSEFLARWLPIDGA